jgi:hypothetical protein
MLEQITPKTWIGLRKSSGLAIGIQLNYPYTRFDAEHSYVFSWGTG